MSRTAVVAYSGGLDTSCILAWLKEDWYGFDEFGGNHGGEWGIVQQHFHSGFVAHACGRSDGFDGAFQAQPQHAGGDELILHGPHVVDGDLRVGTRRVDDDVLAFGVHHDDGEVVEVIAQPDGAGHHPPAQTCHADGRGGLG